MWRPRGQYNSVQGSYNIGRIDLTKLNKNAILTKILLKICVSLIQKEFIECMTRRVVYTVYKNRLVAHTMQPLEHIRYHM